MTKVARMKYILLLGFLTNLLPNEVEMLECYQCIDAKDFECVVNTSLAVLSLWGISGIIPENPDAINNLKNTYECKEQQNSIVNCSHQCEIIIDNNICGGAGNT